MGDEAAAAQRGRMGTAAATPRPHRGAGGIDMRLRRVGATSPDGPAAGRQAEVIPLCRRR
ncbi:ABC transporter [Streptomyces azureus]|uniref:ABC transporter n=1 Tax=Streptomyces azureus TaxID=146537 RepID=A0A0K8PXC4_STRAJ|nr:ABC transporter [Streptomyces azureus]